MLERFFSYKKMISDQEDCSNPTHDPKWKHMPANIILSVQGIRDQHEPQGKQSRRPGTKNANESTPLSLLHRGITHRRARRKGVWSGSSPL
jgi:hypothetical protein